MVAVRGGETLISRSPRPLREGLEEMADSKDWARCCLAVSGSVAAVKAPEIASLLLDAGVTVEVVVSEAAFRLMQASYKGARPWDTLAALEARSRQSADLPALSIWRDADEWEKYTSVGDDAVLHVELAKRNQLLLLAPLCANSLANAALGLCPNLLGSVLRAWYYDLEGEFAAPVATRCGAYAVSRPVLVAPAMNTVMWHQRITQQHLETLRSRGVTVLQPVAKMLACGDTGLGAMAEPATIVREALERLRAHVDEAAAAAAAGKPPFQP